MVMTCIIFKNYTDFRVLFTHILLSFLYGEKAPGGMTLIEFCSKRLQWKKIKF